MLLSWSDVKVVPRYIPSQRVFVFKSDLWRLNSIDYHEQLSLIFLQIVIMRLRSLGFHLLCRVLRIFFIAAAVLLLQLWLPEAAGEKHDLSPTFLSFLSKLFPISPSTTLWAPFGHPEMRVFAPTPLGEASQVTVG